MAELADALASGASPISRVQVQPLFRGPRLRLLRIALLNCEVIFLA